MNRYQLPHLVRYYKSGINKARAKLVCKCGKIIRAGEKFYLDYTKPHPIKCEECTNKK